MFQSLMMTSNDLIDANLATIETNALHWLRSVEKSKELKKWES